MGPPPVPPFPDGAFSRVLCVVAHPDDVEYGTSSAVAAWTAQGIDVTGEALERGIASLEAHGQYLAGIPGHPPPRPMITGITALQGRAMGVGHAVPFRAFDFTAPPPIALEAMRAAAESVG